jgi:hypothetical protein
VPFLEEPYEVELLRGALVHRGFRKAYRSVQAAVLQQLALLFSRQLQGEKEKEKDWEVYVTGHSLGGALATLASFDLARIANGQMNVDATILPSADRLDADKERVDTEKRSKQDDRGLFSFAKSFLSRRNKGKDGTEAAVSAGAMAVPKQLRLESGLQLEDQLDHALLFSTNREFLEKLSTAKLFVYTFGAPRVGNTRFKQVQRGF